MEAGAGTTSLHGRRMPSARAVWLIWCGVILSVTTFPWSDFQGHAHWKAVCWIPFQDTSLLSRLSQVDVAGNFFLFLPFGFLYARSRRVHRWRRLSEVFLWSFTFSAGGELYRVFSHTRIASTTDLAMNVVGAMVGSVEACRRWPAAKHHPRMLMSTGYREPRFRSEGDPAATGGVQVKPKPAPVYSTVGGRRPRRLPLSTAAKSGR